jgi:ABC-type glycerol-3-phosphate transport system permease component
VWAGFFQARLKGRFNLVLAAVLTALPFAGVHVPLLLLSDRRSHRLHTHADRKRVHLRTRFRRTYRPEGDQYRRTTELVRSDVFFWQSLQPATVLVALPIAFVFNLFLDRFVAGFTMGAVKG